MYPNMLAMTLHVVKMNLCHKLLHTLSFQFYTLVSEELDAPSESKTSSPSRKCGFRETKAKTFSCLLCETYNYIAR